MGNTASNFATSAYEAATGKKSQDEVLAEKKAFLEDAYDRLDKNCPQIDRKRLGPAKAVMTDVYEFTFADELATAHHYKRKPLLTLDDVGDAVMSSPTVLMKTAELQAKAYKAGVGTIGGRTKWETARILDAAEGRSVAYVPPSPGPGEMAMTLLGQTRDRPTRARRRRKTLCHPTSATPFSRSLACASRSVNTWRRCGRGTWHARRNTKRNQTLTRHRTAPRLGDPLR